MFKFTQKTLREKISLKGIGLHNGIRVNLTINPAKNKYWHHLQANRLR